MYTACLLAPPYGLGWLLRVAPVVPVDAPRNAEDTVESRRLERASAGAFTDLVTLLGVLLAVLVVAAREPPASMLLVALIGVAMLDVVVRVLVLRHRES